MEYLEITKEQLANSHSLKRGQAVFQPAREILRPFIQAVKPFTKEYVIRARTPKGQAIDFEKDAYGIENVKESYDTYERVAFEAVLDDSLQLTQEDQYDKVIGFIYALDVQNPVAKVYSGYKRRACLNMCIFGASHITKRHFNDSDFDALYSCVPTYLENIATEKEQYINILQDMTETTYREDDLNLLLGTLSRRIVAKENSGLVNNFINMLRLLQVPGDHKGIENIYYNPSKAYTKYDIYQALTASVSRKTDALQAPDIILKAHKLFA